MINKRLDQVLRNTFLIAKTHRHAFVSLEHLLQAILKDEEGARILRNSGADIEKLNGDINRYYEQIELNDDDEDPLHTISFKRVLHKALVHARSAEKTEVTIGDILVMIFEEDDSHACFFMKKQGVNRIDILNYISHGITKLGYDMPDDGPDNVSMVSDSSPEIGYNTQDEPSPSKKTSPLDSFTENWTEMAGKGVFDRIIGRDMEIQRTIEVLCRRYKNNPVFVGDPGVGKTAIVRGLAQRIVGGDIPERLSGYTIYTLDLGSLIAGTRYRGDFEARLKGVLQQLQKLDKVILFIDEIHTIIGAGAAGSSTMDAANMLKPLLADGKVRCIGATTFEEFKNHFEKDRALSRRFQKIEVVEPSEEMAIKILDGLKPVFEKHHGLKYQPSAIESAVKLSARYMNDLRLPDKAVDVMDEAGSQVSLAGGRKTVTTRDVEELVAKIARIPVQAISSTEKENLKDLESSLGGKVFGQQKAIHSIVTAIKRHRAGLGHETKPVGSFLFSGPTGVGKTELCRVLSKEMGIPLIRFDMSEYMEKHTVSRLIGAPAGYIGFEQGGLLTDSVRRNPNAILLLDEIEKAHQDIFNILLQIMDYATLTDNTGRKADFRNVILIMTSNLGSREMSSVKIGFEEAGDGGFKGNPMKAIQGHFTPEFRNRLDDVVIFDRLDKEVIRKIAVRHLDEVRDLLKGKNVTLTADETAYDWLCEKGFDPAFGARPMTRVIQEKVKDRMVDEILFGKLQSGGHVKLTTKDGELDFVFEPRV